MKPRLVLLAGIAFVGVLALGWYFFAPKMTPAGQPPLTALTSNNFDQLRTAFNAASEDVRVFLLLSPT